MLQSFIEWAKITLFCSHLLGACLKRRDVYVAVWPRGRVAKIIEPFYKYYKKFKIIFLINLNFCIFYYLWLLLGGSIRGLLGVK